jgi:hypothetical protein
MGCSQNDYGGVFILTMGCSQNDYGGVVKMNTLSIYISKEYRKEYRRKSSPKSLARFRVVAILRPVLF